jgi:hypothetical protein
MSKTPRHHQPIRMRPTVADWDRPLSAGRDALSALHIDTAMHKEQAFAYTASSRKPFVEAFFRRLNAPLSTTIGYRGISAAPTSLKPMGGAVQTSLDKAAWPANGLPDTLVVDSGLDLESHSAAERQPSSSRGEAGRAKLRQRRRA